MSCLIRRLRIQRTVYYQLLLLIQLHFWEYKNRYIRGFVCACVNVSKWEVFVSAPFINSDVGICCCSMWIKLSCLISRCLVLAPSPVPFICPDIWDRFSLVFDLHNATLWLHSWLHSYRVIRSSGLLEWTSLFSPACCPCFTHVNYPVLVKLSGGLVNFILMSLLNVVLKKLIYWFFRKMMPLQEEWHPILVISRSLIAKWMCLENEQCQSRGSHQHNANCKLCT